MGGGYASLLLGAAGWFTAWGIQMVVFQWLVVAVLQEAPARVGTAQMMVMLPSLLFLLPGGATADRLDPRRVLQGVHVGAAVCVLALLAALEMGAVSYALLLLYAFTFGTIQAFSLPARDTLLSDVVSGPLSRAVAGATMTQHGSQVVGAFIAGSASWVGGAPVLGLQALLLLGGLLPVSRLPVRRRGDARPARLSVRELGDGLLEVLRSPTLRTVLILAIGTGIFFVGPFLVILPLLVRDVYGGGAAQMGILTGMFPLGSVVGGALIVLRGGIERQGRALVAGQLLGAFCIGAVSLGLPFAGTVVAVLGWGVAGALFITSGRTIFQTHASEANRARVLSVYTLGVMGGGPIGSVLSGYLAGPLGLHGTLALDGGLAAVLVFATVATSRVLKIR